jgi:hypothetical protein
MYREQYRAAEDALEDWKADHEEAMAVRILEQLIRILLPVHEGTKELIDAVWEEGFSGQVRNPENLGQWVLKVLRSGIQTWGSLAEHVTECASQGYAVEGDNNVSAALAEERELLADFSARWPFVRKEDVARGAREIAEGKCIAGEDLLRKLQGHSS